MKDITRKNKLFSFVNLDISTQLEIINWELENIGEAGSDFPRMYLELEESMGM